MAKATSKLLEAVSRLIKVAVGALLVPPVIGLLMGLRLQLQDAPLGDRSAWEWAVIGVAGYVTLHLLFYQPAGLFRAQHGLLSGLAQWLFGGQVSTTGDKSAKSSGAEKSRGKGKEKDDATPAQGSTLLVVSPYVVPLYPILICVAAWALKHWFEPSWIDAPAAVLVGATLAMHWVMTADDLQGGRDGKRRLAWDTHLVALGMIGIISLVMVAAALPLAVPGASLPAVLSEALAQAGALYATVFQRLFA